MHFDYINCKFLGRYNNARKLVDKSLGEGYFNEQLEVIEISRNRMDGWQRKAFDKAYKEKVETGTSPLKKQKLQD